MTTTNRLIHQQELDSLVDGEVNDRDRLDLVERIEASVDGWRRCALAFLEAQEIRRALTYPGDCNGQLRGSGAVSERRRISDSTQARPPRVAGASSQRWIVLAVAVLAAFVSGLGVDQVFRNGSSRSESGMPLTDHAIQGSQKAVQPSVAVPTHGNSPEQSAQARGNQQVLPAVEGKPDEIRVVGLVRVAGDSSTNGNYVMPVFAGQGLDQNWLRQMPLPYSDDEVQRFKREGYNVQQRRQLMQVELTDGQNLAIPFGTVHLQYVGDEIH